MRKGAIALVVLVVLFPAVLASHSTRERPESVLNVPSIEVEGKTVTASESYPYTGPRAILPSAVFQDICSQLSGEVTKSVSYTGRFSEDYYDEDSDPAQRLVDLSKPQNKTMNLTGGYWGTSANARQIALERYCSKRDYSSYYDPRVAAFGYHQRVINKDTNYRPEVTIDAPPPQRMLENDARVRSISLPNYVDVSEVPYYVPPANPKERVYLFTEVEQDRLTDNQGAYRFIPGNWEDRSYYYQDEHTYALPTDRAQRILRAPELMAQRVLAPGGYGRAQRLLNDQYGEEYGYTITAPSLIEIYDVQTASTGSVHDGRLFQYIRHAGKLPADYLHYTVDPRLVNEEDIEAVDAAYREAYYDTIGISPTREDEGVVSPEGASYRRFPRLSTVAYYQQKLAFLNSRQQFINRRASRAPVSYADAQVLNSERYGAQSDDAQRILKYEGTPTPDAQRILGYEASTAQRTIG